MLLSWANERLFVATKMYEQEKCMSVQTDVSVVPFLGDLNLEAYIMYI